MADEKKQAGKQDSDDKEALKARKQAEKDALKAKKDRIKQSKPKKTAKQRFAAIGAAIKKFFKDFRGTCKKVIWPDRKTVLKNTLIVFVTVIIVGIGIWIVDFAFSEGVGALNSAAKNYSAEQESINEAEEAASAAAEETAASGETSTDSAPVTTTEATASATEADTGSEADAS